MPISANDDPYLTLASWTARVGLPGGQVIREARPEEYPGAEDLLVAAFTTGCWVSPDYERGLRTLAHRAELFRIWVAVDADEHLLGLVLTPRIEFLEAAEFTFSLLAVGPRGRGLRLGSALVDHAVKLARSYGFAQIEIHSSPQMSQAHRLYYASGFVRRVERETIIASEWDERLLTFTLRVPDPLPEAQVLRVPRRPRPLGSRSFGARRPLSELPPAPAGRVDESGAFLPDASVAPVLQEARRWAARQGLGSVAAGVVARQIEADLWAGAHTVLFSPVEDASRAALQVFFARLDHLEARLASTGTFLGGDSPASADVLLARVLLAYDLGWRAAFPPASGAVADWPRLWNQARSVLHRLDLPQETLAALGLGDHDDSRTEPFGPLPPVFDLADVRAGWLSRPGALRRRRPARTPGVPATPWSGPLTPAPADVRARLQALAGEVEQASALDPEADRGSVEVVREDLLAPLVRLAEGADAPLQHALRRVFFARLAWLDQRVGAVGTLDRAPAAVTPVLRAFQTWLGDVLPPIDPVVADFSALAAWLSATGGCPVD